MLIAKPFAHHTQHNKKQGGKQQQQQQPQQPGSSSEPAVRLTRSQTRALQSGASLSSILQARSEAAKPSSARQPSQQQQQQRESSPLPDIDGSDRTNPLAATDYVDDVYRYYRRVEPQFRVPADYMSTQVGAVFWSCSMGGSSCWLDCSVLEQSRPVTQCLCCCPSTFHPPTPTHPPTPSPGRHQ